VEYLFVDTTTDNFEEKLLKLLGEPIIGLDVEWKPIFVGFKQEIPSIF
jgi:hypothetical protein